MRLRLRFRARLPLWCSVPAGVLAAHAIGYAIAYRDARYRADMLAATGHGYLGHAMIVAVIAGAAAVSVAVARGVRERQSMRWWDAALRTGAVQTAAFVGVEILERIAAGVDPFAGMRHVLFIGAVVQVFMGAIVASVLLAFERAGRTIVTVARAERRPRIARRPNAFAIPIPPAPKRVVRLASVARGPPLLLAST